MHDESPGHPHTSEHRGSLSFSGRVRGRPLWLANDPAGAKRSIATNTHRLRKFYSQDNSTEVNSINKVTK